MAIRDAEFTFASIVLAGKKAHVLANDARTFREDWSYISDRGELGSEGHAAPKGVVTRVDRSHFAVSIAMSISAELCARPGEFSASTATAIVSPARSDRCRIRRVDL